MTNNTNPFEGEELPPDPTDISSATLRRLAAGIDAGQLDDEEYQAAVRALEMLTPANRQPSSSDEALDWIGGEDIVLSRLALEYLTDRLEKAEPLAFTPWRSREPPPRKWLIKEWLPAGRVVMLSGTGGAGKSRLALQLAAGIASGGNDRGEWIQGASFPGLALATTAPAPVVFASWEDEPEEFHRRLSDLSGSNTPWVTPDNLAHLLPVDMAGQGPVWAPASGRHIATLATITPTGERLRRLCESQGARLLVLDPLAAAYAADENARGLVRAFVSDWDAWARANDCAVLILAHPPKSGADYAGSTDWQGSVRALWTLSQETIGLPPARGQPDCRTKVWTLDAVKGNYGAAPDPVQLAWDHTGGGLRWQINATIREVPHGRFD